MLIQEAIAKILETEGIGAVGEKIYIEYLPDLDMEVVGIFLYDSRYEASWDGYVSRLQIRNRSFYPLEGLSLAERILEIVKYKTKIEIENISIILMRALQGVQTLGKIEKYFEYVVNVEVFYKE